ncbi:MAG TPA: amino acid permease [Longimicrobiales bacterium]|nr:amino acid permease [Longimicrobiales bacterium]
MTPGRPAAEDVAAPGAATDPGLVRGLGPLAATTLVAGAVIGSGIFLSPALVAREVGAPGLSLLVWVVCGVLALCGALCYAELGAAIPRSGGTYAFLHRAFRVRWLPFLFGWAMFAVVLTGVMAAVATAFATYAGQFLDDVIPYGTWAQRGVAIGCIAFLTVMNCIGVRVGGRIQVLFTFAKLLGVGSLIAAGLLLNGAHAGSLTPLLPAERGGISGAFVVAMIVALFAYNGWWYTTFVAGEVRDPERTIPRSIFAGMGIVLVLYMLANVVYLVVLPFDELQASSRPAADAMLRLVGPHGADIIAAAVMLSAFGTVNAQLLSVPRVYFAMARDGLFFDAVARVHPRFRTPAAAIALQGAWASVLALTGTYQQIITYTAFPNYLFLSLGVVALIVLRVREPGLPRPFRVPLYPLTPLLFLGIFAWYLVNSVLHSFTDTMVGIALTLAGLPLYFFWSRRRNTAVEEIS